MTTVKTAPPINVYFVNTISCHAVQVFTEYITIHNTILYVKFYAAVFYIKQWLDDHMGLMGLFKLLIFHTKMDGTEHL